MSGYPAVGKTTVARAVAKELGLRYLGGGEALQAVALRKGYSPTGGDWWDTEGGMAFLRERTKDPRFDKEVDEELLKAVAKGDIVITSYTLPWLTDKGLKFWLSASAENRARRMAERDSISYRAALKVVNQRDRENKKLYRALYGFEFGRDLSPFDFVVSTDRLGREQVIKVTLFIVKQFA